MNAMTPADPPVAERRRVLAVLAILLALTVVLAGCGSVNTPTEPTTSPSSSVQPSASTSPPPARSSAPRSFTATKTWTWESKNPTGYTAHYAFSVGSPVKLHSAPIMPGFTQQSDISGACSDFSPQTDAVLPARLTLTNTTSGFSQDVSTFFELQESFASNALSDLEVVSGYTAGPQCEDIGGTDGSGSDWTVDCQLQAQASCSNYSYLLLKNYYSPNNPAGDTKALAAVLLSVEDTTTTSGYVSIVRASGPGAQVEPDKYRVDIPLAG